VQDPGDAPFSNQNEPSITVSGVLAGATVDLYQIDPQTGQPGASLDSVTSVNGGTATVTPTTPVADGQDTFYVTQTVSEGTGSNQQMVTSDINPSLQNNKADVHVDTAAPFLMTSFMGSSTNNNEPGFLYSLSGVYSTVAKVRLVDANTGQTLGEGSSINSGEWVPTSPLPDGQYSVYAVSIDDAGNVGTEQSPPVDFTVDTVAPPPPTRPTPTPPGTTPVAPVAPPVTTTPAPPTGSSPPVAVASATVTAHAGVVELNASRSTAAAGKTITAYSWYLGAKLLGHTEFLDYGMPPGVSRGTVTLRVTDSAGATSTAQVVVSAHGHETTVALSTKTLFAYNSARLTPSAKRLLTKLRAVILASPRVSIDGYTATGPRQTRRQKTWSARLSVKRAQAVAAFLFGGHVPSSVHLSVKGMGGAHDRSGAAKDRRSTITYERFVVTVQK
jgi:outer membrane protein OmpA-like peptidoglycan-associated protein